MSVYFFINGSFIFQQILVMYLTAITDLMLKLTCPPLGALPLSASVTLSPPFSLPSLRFLFSVSCWFFVLSEHLNVGLIDSVHCFILRTSKTLSLNDFIPSPGF